MEQAPKFSPTLLRETAEIALTEIKRFIEPRLGADLSLRRVSAPMYLPASSGLNGLGRAVAFGLAGSHEQMEVVTGLDRWLRRQLERYDIAPGFGVFTVMNALRPDIDETATTSPHVAAWAWQQVRGLDGETSILKELKQAAAAVYDILRGAEKMLCEKFPHMPPTLPETLVTVGESEVIADQPAGDLAKSEYEYIRKRPRAAYFIVNDSAVDGETPSGRLLVWNDVARCQLELAEILLYEAGDDAPVASVGGNIWRDRLAMQLFHRESILKPY